MQARRTTHGARRIVVGMSGGVDSSVAAALCLEQGYEVAGVFLRNGVEDVRPAVGDRAAPRARAERPRCCSAGDAADARAVAARLGIAFYAFDESEPFEGLIQDFADAYAAGRTPNPCVACNRDVKIAALERVAQAVGAELVATGHYARHDAGGRRLRRAADRRKDQTYFLAGLTQRQVERCRFPLGELTKDAVRAAAARLGLAVAGKPESQEICFVAGSSYREVVAERRADATRPGDIVDTDGRVVGRHDGIAGFTIGQRRGLGLGGGGDVLHVIALDARANRVVVGPAERLERHTLAAGNMRWWGERPAAPFRAWVQIRHRHAGLPATVTPAGGTVHVDGHEPVRGVAPGQTLAIYDGESNSVLLGAGTIVAHSTPHDVAPPATACRTTAAHDPDTAG